jgi:hypothetical protein
MPLLYLSSNVAQVRMLQLGVTRQTQGDREPGLSRFSSRSQRRVRKCAGVKMKTDWGF